MSTDFNPHDKIDHIREYLLSELQKLRNAGNVKPALDKVIEIVEHLLHLHSHAANIIAPAVVVVPVVTPVVVPVVVETAVETAIETMPTGRTFEVDTSESATTSVDYHPHHEVPVEEAPKPEADVAEASADETTKGRKQKKV